MTSPIDRETKTWIEASIKWKRDNGIPFGKSGKRRQIYKWEQNNSISFFYSTWKYDLVPNSLNEETRRAQYYFQLYLKQIKSLAHLDVADDDIDLDCDTPIYYNKEELNGNKPIYFNKEEFTDEERESKLNYWDRPTAIRADIWSTKTTLKRTKLNEWTSERLVCACAERGSCPPSPTSTCVFWIKYEHLNRGEKSLLKHLEDLYIQQIQCDIHFRFNENVEIEIEGDDHSDEDNDDDEENYVGDESVVDEENDLGGHIAILTARSPVFAAMFKFQMEEIKTGCVTIEDIRKDIFKELLHYIYSGRTEMPLTEKTARPLFVAANKYDIEELKEDCVDFLLTCFRLDNAISLLIWADFYSVGRLLDAALEFIAKYGILICQQDDWETLIKNYPDLSLLATRRMIK